MLVCLRVRVLERSIETPRYTIHSPQCQHHHKHEAQFQHYINNTLMESHLQGSQGDSSTLRLSSAEQQACDAHVSLPLHLINACKLLSVMGLT